MPDDPSSLLPSTVNIHASCVVMGGQGVLLLGPSGAGKSDLALRLMDRGARLVADDRCDIRHEDGHLHASAPEALAGLIEVRGLGIIARPFQPCARLALAVELRPGYDRFPLGKLETLVAGHPLPAVRLNAFEISAPVKIMLALETLCPAKSDAPSYE